MLDLKHVGLFLRDDVQEYPSTNLERLFRRAGIDLQIDARNVPGEYDLVIALGGDGTVMRALTAYPEAPVLAVRSPALT